LLPPEEDQKAVPKIGTGLRPGWSWGCTPGCGKWPATGASSPASRPHSRCSTWPCGTWRSSAPERRDPQLRVETGAAVIHDLLRRTNPNPM